MISLISREKLDVDKYNACVENSMQANIFGFSWYLDIACENWSVLVLDNYEAVMPIPWRKKFFIKYVYPPFWVLQLGIYSKVVEDENEFLIELFSEFKFVESRLNTQNSFSMFLNYRFQKHFQILGLEQDYIHILSKYRKDRKKDLQRAKKADLTERWNDQPQNLIKLYHQNVGARVRKIKEKDYENLLKLMQRCIDKKVGEILSVYDKNGQIVASGFFIKYKGRVSILVSSTDFKRRKNGANTFLIDRAIYKYQPTYKIFDFGGSSMKSISKYFLSFGSHNESYYFLKYNNLPKFLKFFKR
ncbi:hypothetical protein [Tenacibaculum sp. IB213877]|uniref:hypothetical protein n=1 Tax=Tenacibaculum sp. IB213877 TaxID=3097351 RepID=UPI002A5ACF2A|nr:hypothetical protein [Tenacibaculum sp. IB213877]MDY0780093.1 hypothetical protein [Tenacibaculum sp. IB213877]